MRNIFRVLQSENIVESILLPQKDKQKNRHKLNKDNYNRFKRKVNTNFVKPSQGYNG